MWVNAIWLSPPHVSFVQGMICRIAQGKIDDMAIEQLPSADRPPNTIFESLERRTDASYECELATSRSTEIRLREALARDEALLRQKDALFQQHEVSSKEFDHRLLNSLQMIVSLLSLQSRASTNTEAASQLAVAADRVATIERVHRRLHWLDGVQTVAFKQYLEEFCRDFSPMLSSQERPEQVIVVEGIEIKLPAATAIPLSFIVNELITNAVKYGHGRITIRLEPNPGNGCALSVSNDGPALPEGFDPAASKGLGMKIIRAFIGRIGGELRIARGDKNQGTRFTVLFS
jgi:two-component system, sensor histidine kinase PdtaS